MMLVYTSSKSVEPKNVAIVGKKRAPQKVLTEEKLHDYRVTI